MIKAKPRKKINEKQGKEKLMKKTEVREERKITGKENIQMENENKKEKQEMRKRQPRRRNLKRRRKITEERKKKTRNGNIRRKHESKNH